MVVKLSTLSLLRLRDFNGFGLHSNRLLKSNLGSLKQPLEVFTTQHLLQAFALELLDLTLPLLDDPLMIVTLTSSVLHLIFSKG